MKKVAVPVMALSLLFNPAMGNVASAYSDLNTKEDVIVIYKNEEGKNKVMEESVAVDHEFETVNAVSASLTKKDIQDLEKDPDIARIEPNITFTVAGGENVKVLNRSAFSTANVKTQWNADMINATKAWEDGYTGKGVKIAVIDSGVINHPELNIAGGVSTVDYTTSWIDDNGHGSHVAGIIGAKQGYASVNGSDVVGVAPNVELYAVKAMDKNGDGTLQDILEAIDWAIQNDMDIINLSLGTTEHSPLLEEMVNRAYNEGIIVVGASGNDGYGTPVNYPAKYDSVIAVSSINRGMNVSIYSSTGKEIEFSAPGEDIVSTYLNNQYAMMSGTSQATPHVSGMFALLKEVYPTKSNKELRKIMQGFVEDLGATGRDSDFGYGYVKYSTPDLTAPTNPSDEISEPSNPTQPTPSIEEDLLVSYEKIMEIISKANQSRKLWDYDSARHEISKLKDSKEKAELLQALKTLQENLGLVEFSSILNINLDKSFKVTFSSKIDKNSVNHENIFIRKDGEFVQGLELIVSDDEKSVTVKAPKEGFKPKSTYFLYVDRTIKGKNGLNLKFPVIVMFTTK